MWQWRAASVPGLFTEVDTKGLTGPKFDPSFLEGAQTQFRSLQIGEDAYRASRDVLKIANRPEPSSVVLMGAVAEVQPEYVDAGFEQVADPLRRRARGPECCDDLGAAEPPCFHLPTTTTLIGTEILSQIFAGDLSRPFLSKSSAF